jgi:hypothetical protein
MLDLATGGRLSGRDAGFRRVVQEDVMLRQFVFALLFAVGIGGAASLPSAQAAVIQPGAATSLAQAAAAPGVTPVWHYGRPHYRPYRYRPYRPYYRGYYGPRCRVVRRRVWTEYGYRWVTRRVCRPRYY